MNMDKKNLHTKYVPQIYTGVDNTTFNALPHNLSLNHPEEAFENIVERRKCW